MFYGKSKRIIVIKDIQSNLFEEAILVLKESRGRENDDKQRLNSKKTNNKNDFILKEAELIINNFIKENKGSLNEQKKKELVQDNKLVKNIIINSALIGSIAAVVFLLLKMF